MFRGGGLDWEREAEDGSDSVNKQALAGVFFSFFKHYSATSEVSLFLNVLINKVTED